MGSLSRLCRSSSAWVGGKTGIEGTDGSFELALFGGARLGWGRILGSVPFWTLRCRPVHPSGSKSAEPGFCDPETSHDGGLVATERNQQEAGPRTRRTPDPIAPVGAAFAFP
jgi:hypothetical protein